jgi:DMSO/TMAO reductase YedYZ molybdopterin-dependent catalytic subunit
MARTAETEAPPKGTPVGRRVFLGMVGLAAAGVAFGSKAQDWLEHALAPITARDGTGLSSFLPVGRFRIYSVTGDLPNKSAVDYRLKVGGHVDQPLDLSFADLQAMPPTNLDKDFQCVTGWRVHNVKWPVCGWATC